MANTITEINIIPVKPNNGLIAFASFVLNDSWYMGSIGILTRPESGYRLVYPTKKVNERNINIFHPINAQMAREIENTIISRYEDVMNHDRHGSIGFTK